MEELWINLYERGYIEIDDVHLLQLWLAALVEIGYSFPEIPKRRRKRHHNVVIMGQFNYAAPADRVVFWTQHWRQLFSNIVVQGPFDAATVQELQARGVQVYESPSDKGFYSPMTNLARTLLQAYNQQQEDNNSSNPTTKIDGVLYIHDDGMLNMSAVLGSENHFPTDTIIGSLLEKFPYSYKNPRDLVNAPDLSRYSYRVHPNGTLSIDLSNRMNWQWWDSHCMPGIYEIMARSDDPEYSAFLEPDGSFVVPSPVQADFLYVPVEYAREFHAAAQVMARHKIFLECGFPIIVDKILHRQRQPAQLHDTGNTTTTTTTKQPATSKTRTVELCSYQGPLRGTDEMYTSCRDDNLHTYGMYHPFKMSRGLAWWSHLFQSITFDDGQ